MLILQSIFVINPVVGTKNGFKRPVQGTLVKPIDFNVFHIQYFSIGFMARAVSNWSNVEARGEIYGPTLDDLSCDLLDDPLYNDLFQMTVIMASPLTHS